MSLMTLLLSPGFWVAVAITTIGLALYGAVLASLVSAWTDDRKWLVQGRAFKMYISIYGKFGLNLSEDDEISPHEMLAFWIVASVMLFATSVVGFIAGAIVHFVWPVAVAIVGGYVIVRAVRFARRTKKVIGKITGVAHEHKADGAVSKKKINTPEF